MIALVVVAAVLALLGGLTREIGSDRQASGPAGPASASVLTVEENPEDGFSIKPIDVVPAASTDTGTD